MWAVICSLNAIGCEKRKIKTSIFTLLYIVIFTSLKNGIKIDFVEDSNTARARHKGFSKVAAVDPTIWKIVSLMMQNPTT